MVYGNGVELLVKCEGKIGLRFEKEQGGTFVARGSIASEPPDLLEEGALSRDDYKLSPYELSLEPKVGKLASLEKHMANFCHFVPTRRQPSSSMLS